MNLVEQKCPVQVLKYEAQAVRDLNSFDFGGETPSAHGQFSWLPTENRELIGHRERALPET